MYTAMTTKCSLLQNSLTKTNNTGSIAVSMRNTSNNQKIL